MGAFCGTSGHRRCRFFPILHGYKDDARVCLARRFATRCADFSYLEGMGGVEKFYFLDAAKYLLVKYRDQSEGRISILKHDGATGSESYSICREAA